MHSSSLLFAASEVYPFAKSGGLADVVHSLPKALQGKYNVEVIMPLYQFIDRELYNIQADGEMFNITMGDVIYPVTLYMCNYEGLIYRFIYTPILCDREFLYGPSEGGYEDNHIRFGLFNYALLEVLKREKYEVVHLNDWQCALLPLLIQDTSIVQTKSVFTIHNLAYQGVFDKKALTFLGIDETYFTMDGLEFYGKVNFMKAGIAYADTITTVSPTYAKEILTSKYGCGLDGFLRHHRDKLVGIVNGIDTEHFSPAHDKMLITPYVDLKGKAVNKRAYIKEIKLSNHQNPLMIFIGRFTWQKGLEILIDTLPGIASMECNIAILGEGEAQYNDALQEVAQQHDNIHLGFGYDEALSHRMYAASDFFLMPSLFEPCGLAQMIAMHYGSMPIVHSVGGLLDTVKDYETFDTKSQKGYGVVFDNPNTETLLKAVKEAMQLYERKKHYNQIIKHNMLCDFSWEKSAELYIKEYKKIQKGSDHE